MAFYNLKEILMLSLNLITIALPKSKLPRSFSFLVYFLKNKCMVYFFKIKACFHVKTQKPLDWETKLGKTFLFYGSCLFSNPIV